MILGIGVVLPIFRKKEIEETIQRDIPVVDIPLIRLGDEFSDSISDGGRDGYVYGIDVIYSIARNLADGSDDLGTSFFVGQKYVTDYTVYRGFLEFNTSGIPDDAEITKAVLKLGGASDYSTIDFIIRIQKWTDTTPIDTNDYNSYDDINYDAGNFSTSGFSTAVNYIYITNFSIINVTGFTRFCLRSSRDISETTPTGNEYVTFDTLESGNAPSLIITYKVGRSWNKVFSGSHTFGNTTEVVERGMMWDKYLLNDKPTYIMEISTEPRNYLNETGNWSPIIKNLQDLPTLGYRYINKKGIYHFYGKENINDTESIAISHNQTTDTNYMFRIRLYGMGYYDPTKPDDSSWKILEKTRNVSAVLQDDSLKFTGVYTGADAIYSYDSKLIKERIILTNDTKQVFKDNPPSSFGFNESETYTGFFVEVETGGLDVYNNSVLIDTNYTFNNTRVKFCKYPGEPVLYFNIPEIYNNTETYFGIFRRHYNASAGLRFFYGIKNSTLSNMTFPVTYDPTIEIEIDEEGDDGSVYRYGADYVGVQSASSGTGLLSGSTMRTGQRFTSVYYYVYRAFLEFDTSDLPADADISNATLRLYGGNDYSVDDFTIRIQKWTGEPPPGTDDYAQFDGVNYDDGTYNTTEFDVSDYNYIYFEDYSVIVKGGLTRLCLRSEKDINQIAPDTSEFVYFDTYESSDPAPCLIITYETDTPTITLIHPPHGATGVEATPRCKIEAGDPNGDTLTVYWYENTTGDWVLRNTNESVPANSTVSYVYPQFDGFYTQYWWRVNVSDGTHETSETYTFTTGGIRTKVDEITPYNVSTSPLTITARGNGSIANVTLYYRYSDTNETEYQNRTIFEGFETEGQNTSLWGTYSSTDDGVIDFDHTESYEGSYSCAMYVDTDNTDNLNEIFTVYDFTDAKNINIDFWQYDNADEETYAPDNWTGHYNADAVAFTNDGNTWYEIIDGSLLQNSKTWEHFTYNISNDPDFDENVTASFSIKFQQFDNYPLDYDGRFWDAIYINFSVPVVKNLTDWIAYDIDTDGSDGWSWSFNFPNGTGYYFFASVGKASGVDDEDLPPDYDTSCNFVGEVNNPPVQSNPNPPDGATDVDPIPTLSVDVSDPEGDTMNATWFSNSSGTWEKFGENLSISNSTIYQTNSNFSEICTTYWWSVNLTDGVNWNNQTYKFTTTVISNVTPSVVSCLVNFTAKDEADSIRIFHDTNPGIDTNDNYTYIDPEDCNLSNRKQRTMIIEELRENTTYYYRLYNVDTSSWYTNERNFTTKERFTTQYNDSFYDMYLVNSSDNVKIVQQTGVKDPNNPLIDWTYGSQPNGVGYICVMNDSGTWRLWALNYSGTTYNRLCYFASTDGQSWSFVSDIDTSPTPDRCFPNIIKIDGVYYNLYKSTLDPRASSISNSTQASGTFTRLPDGGDVINSAFVDGSEAEPSCFFKDIYRNNLWYASGQGHQGAANTREVAHFLGFNYTSWLYFDRAYFLNIETTIHEDGQYSDYVYMFPVQLIDGVYVGIHHYWNQSSDMIEPYLAVSRDGITYDLVQNDTMIIPLGASGTWDDGMIFAARTGTIITSGDYDYLYYNAHDDLHENSASRTTRIGRIRFRKQGLTAIEPTSSSGWFLTKPIPSRFVANFTLNGNFSETNTLKIAVINASNGQVYENFSFADFTTITTNSTNITPMWGDRNLSNIPEGDFQLNFSFSGDDGQLFHISMDEGKHYVYKVPIHISNPYPPNNAVGVELTPTLKITVEHDKGEAMDITWKWKNGTTWEIIGVNSSVYNGTYSQLFSNATETDTRYTWSVNVSGSWANESFVFTTIGDKGWIPEDREISNGSANDRAKSIVYDSDNNCMYVFYFDYSDISEYTHLCCKRFWFTNNTWDEKFQFDRTNYPVGTSYDSYYETHLAVAAVLDKEKHIWLVYGGHATSTYPISSVRSKYPVTSSDFDYKNTDSWELPNTVTSIFDSSYQHIGTSWNNTYLVFLREGNDYMSLYWSYDNGTTWRHQDVTDEAYGVYDFIYDPDTGEDYLLCGFGKAKTSGSGWGQDWRMHFFWMTVNHTIQGNGAYTSQNTTDDDPYYSFPVEKTDIIPQDDFGNVRLYAQRYYSIGFNTKDNTVFLGLSNVSTTTDNANGEAWFINKTLGTTEDWTHTMLLDDDITGDNKRGIHDITYHNNRYVAITLYKDGDNFKPRYGFTTTPTVVESWNWQNHTVNNYSDVQPSFIVKAGDKVVIQTVINRHPRSEDNPDVTTGATMDYILTKPIEVPKRIWQKVFSGWHSFGNISAYQKVFSGYHTFGNISSYKEIFSGYHNFGNISNYQKVFSGFHTFGNISQFNEVFSGYHTFGNISNFQLVFSGWHSFSNTSTYKLIFSGYHTFGNISEYQQVFSGYHTLGNVSEFRQVFSGYHIFSNVSNWNNIIQGWHVLNNISQNQLIFSGYHTFGNISNYKEVISGWHVLDNTSVIGWEKIIQGWHVLNNITEYHKIISGWHSFNNISQYNEVISGYHTFGHLQNWNKILSGWHVLGNISKYQKVFSGYHSFGNVTNYKQVLQGWHVFENTSVVGWEKIISGWHVLNNVSSSKQVLQGWHTFNNISSYQLVFSGYHSFGNITIEEWSKIFSGWHKFGNVTNYSKIFSGWHVLNNLSEFDEIFSGWHSFGHEYNWQKILQGQHSFGNITSVQKIFSGWHTFANGTKPIQIINPQPANGSTIYVMQPWICFELRHPYGKPMNYTIYTGDALNNTNISISYGVNVGNGTYKDIYYGAQSYGDYYWRVYVTDGDEHTNRTFYFTIIGDIEIAPSTPDIGVLGVFLALVIMFYYFKRKNFIKGKKENA